MARIWGGGGAATPGSTCLQHQPCPSPGICGPCSLQVSPPSCPTAPTPFRYLPASGRKGPTPGPCLGSAECDSPDLWLGPGLRTRWLFKPGRKRLFEKVEKLKGPGSIFYPSVRLNYLRKASQWFGEAMATYSSTPAWKIPWMEEPGRLQSMGSLRVGHNRATSLSLFTFMHWRRKWQPTPVFLPGESQGRRSLVGCCLWGQTESDTTDTT